MTTLQAGVNLGQANENIQPNLKSTLIYFEVQILLLLFQLVNPQMSPKFKHVVFCLENWAQEGKIPPVLDGLTLTHRGIYSCTVAFLQYLLPLLVVLIIYAMIYRFLRQQQYPRHLRQNKTNTLLASISLTHCLMWLPFSVFNILADLWGEQVRNIQFIYHYYQHSFGKLVF